MSFFGLRCKIYPETLNILIKGIEELWFVLTYILCDKIEWNRAETFIALFFFLKANKRSISAIRLYN